MNEPADPTPAASPVPAPRPVGQVLAGAWAAIPVAVGLLGALVGAMQDCSASGWGPLVLFAFTGAGLAASWARRSHARLWLMLLSTGGGGLLAVIAGTCAWTAVAFERCFTF